MSVNRLDRYPALEILDGEPDLRQALALTRPASFVVISGNPDSKGLDKLILSIKENQRQIVIDGLLTVFTTTGMRYMLEDLQMERLRLQLRVDGHNSGILGETPQISTLSNIVRNLIDALCAKFHKKSASQPEIKEKTKDISNIDDLLKEIGYLNLLEQFLKQALEEQITYEHQCKIDAQNEDADLN